MPNWCINEVSVYGTKEEINKFKELVTSKDSKFDFNKILPMPEELDKFQSPSNTTKEVSASLVEKYGYDNWYDWKIYNWGTKWSAGEVGGIFDDDYELQYFFDTAWSPPEGIFYELYERFDSATFSISWFYREDGVQMAGWLGQ